MMAQQKYGRFFSPLNNWSIYRKWNRTSAHMNDYFPPEIDKLFFVSYLAS
jgi:hypothetical protein